MVKQNRGKIINIASGYGLRGGKHNYMYACAKGGMIQLTRSMALTYAQFNIQTNCIVPGIFPHNEEMMQFFKGGKFIPIGRVGDDSELGPLAVFLASDASNHINGELIAIDGGGLAGGITPTGVSPETSTRTEKAAEKMPSSNSSNDFSLEGKGALVVGAEHPVGRAAAVTLAEAGAKVLLASQEPGTDKQLKEVAKLVQAAGAKPMIRVQNAAMRADLSATADLAAKELGGLDILVNALDTPAIGPAEAPTTPHSTKSSKIISRRCGCRARRARA